MKWKDGVDTPEDMAVYIDELLQKNADISAATKSVWIYEIGRPTMKIFATGSRS